MIGFLNFEYLEPIYHKDAKTLSGRGVRFEGEGIEKREAERGLRDFVGFYYFWGFYFVCGSGFGLSFVGFGYRLCGVVGIVHCALEVANCFAHRAAYVAEFAWPEDH